MKNSIFHISHTDIRRDSRIIKELKVISNEFVNCDIFAIGIKRVSHLNNIKLSLSKVQDLSISLITKKFFFIPKSILYFLNYLEFFLKCILKIYSKKIAIIHCHDFLVLPIGYIAKLLFNCKLIYDAHELESEKNFVKYPKIIFLIERLLWKKIDLFITVSPSILNWYHKKMGYKKNSVIVLNAPEITNKNIINNISLRRKLKIPKNQLIFLYVGSFLYGRGINLFLKVFSNPKINSALVFLGYGEMEDKIKKFSKKYSNIYYSKPVSHSRLAQFIKSSDVGLCVIEKVSLSYYYSLPNKFFEFAFSNLHILASNFPDMRNLINTYSIGSCISPNYNMLIKKIQFFEANRHKIKIKRKNLRDLEWGTQSEKLINGYRKII